MYFIQPPPGIQWDNPYSYVQSATITTAGSKVLIPVTIDSDQSIWVRRPRISAYYNDAGNLSRVVPTTVQQDQLLVTVKRGTGNLHTENPADLHEWNGNADDFLYPGWTIPAASVLSFEVTHRYTGTPRFQPPITITVHLSGYRIARSAG